MSKKCVIDIFESTRMVMQIGVNDKGKAVVCSTPVDHIEELNSDYINEHYGDLQDTAYQRGFDDAHKISREEYQRGLNDAWECARKLFSSMADSDIEKAFPTEWNNGGFHALINLQPQEAIEKLKAYEEKQKADDEIKVGDVIANNTEPKLKVWVTSFDEIGFCGTAITNFGTVDEGKLYASCSPKGWHKIGHFDIEKILEAMKK